jgi:type II secretory pathway pseudopilin PulG
MVFPCSKIVAREARQSGCRAGRDRKATLLASEIPKTVDDAQIQPAAQSFSDRVRITHSLRKHAEAGMTLIEVIVALVVFTLGSIGFTMAYGLMNTRATRVRCDAAASAILRAKVAKVLTDPWIIQSVPVDCVVTNGMQLTTADPNDPYDVGPTVVLLSQSDSPQTGFVTGSIYRNTYVFESAADTVAVDYQITYAFRNKTYSVYASTVRARDD